MPQDDKDALPESFLHFNIPLQRALELDCDWLMRRFVERWASRVACAENPAWGLPERGLRKYMLLDNKKNSILLTVIPEPLPPGLRELLIQSAPNIGEAEKQVLHDHRGTILLDYALGSAKPLERAMLSAKVLLTLMELDGALGYTVKSAQSYRAFRWIADLGLDKAKELNAAVLLFLLTTKHAVGERSQTWLHTHGMEQFALPDIEVRVPAGGQYGYWDQLIDNMELYMVENGPVVKVGHTLSLQDDEETYVARETTTPEEFGHFSAIHLVKTTGWGNSAN